MSFFSFTGNNDKKKDGGLSAFGEGIGLQYNRILASLGIFDDSFDETFN